MQGAQRVAETRIGHRLKLKLVDHMSYLASASSEPSGRDWPTLSNFQPRLPKSSLHRKWREKGTWVRRGGIVAQLPVTCSSITLFSFRLFAIDVLKEMS
jgi:hypothetical protein